MNIVMSYIDYNMAGLSDREKFSCTKTQINEIYVRLMENRDILGSVMIATCNRTELYLSMKDHVEADPFEQLCRAMGYEYRDYEYMHQTLNGDDAVRHLCRVAAGSESQLWGDSQIITQVREAIVHARQVHASDTLLNVIFRTAVTAGKKIKTNVDFNIHDDSTAVRAAEKVAEDPSIKRVLVIGNGVMGRLITRNLLKAGRKVTMTLRQYRHGEIVVPDGADTVMYSDRYKAMEQCDAVVSATSSPHFTVHKEDMEKVERVPELFIDMAVPRDIDPEVAERYDTCCLNIDEISRGQRDARQDMLLSRIDSYIEGYIRDFHHWYDYRENMEKIIYVVGIGPGNSEYMTPQARSAILDSDVVVGYTVYVDLVRDLCDGKTVRATAMKQEVDRCNIALDYAVRGKKVAFVCSGDAGVYGMAGVMSEVAKDRPDVKIVTIPGITAACSGAAVLGAPLIHDFSVISLSDLLTPWETIEKRLRLAAEADFVICLYNPKSKKRRDYIDKAAEIISGSRPWETPCGYVKNIGRDGEAGIICSLSDLCNNDEIDMFTTVFVGNSSTKVINGRLVTPRGYREVR